MESKFLIWCRCSPKCTASIKRIDNLPRFGKSFMGLRIWQKRLYFRFLYLKFEYLKWPRVYFRSKLQSFWYRFRKQQCKHQTWHILHDRSFVSLRLRENYIYWWRDPWWVISKSCVPYWRINIDGLRYKNWWHSLAFYFEEYIKSPR